MHELKEDTGQTSTSFIGNQGDLVEINKIMILDIVIAVFFHRVGESRTKGHWFKGKDLIEISGEFLGI